MLFVISVVSVEVTNNLHDDSLKRFADDTENVEKEYKDKIDRQFLNGENIQISICEITHEKQYKVRIKRNKKISAEGIVWFIKKSTL